MSVFNLAASSGVISLKYALSSLFSISRMLDRTQLSRSSLTCMAAFPILTGEFYEPNQINICSATGESIMSLSPQNFPQEVFLCFAGPVGSNMAETIKIFERELRTFDFHPIEIHITNGLQAYFNDVPDQFDDYKARYDTLISASNKLRQITKKPDVMTHLASTAISELRKRIIADGTPKKIAYLIRQIKRPEEIAAFRNIYGRSFYTVSLYSDPRVRLERISRSISKQSIGRIENEIATTQAEQLLRDDEFQEEEKLGQNLRSAFPMADAFIDTTKPDEVGAQVARFCKLLFGANDESPTRAEYGMYMAKSASLRSLDLSRQVGAAIFSEKSVIKTLGCNEVPSSAGGTYWSGDPGDSREIFRGYDTNDDMKIRMLDDVLLNLRLNDALVEEYKNVSGKQLLQKIEESEQKSRYRNLIMMDTIEFGRIIHAEMNAITDAARNGISLSDTIMYCTTFPCHLCAKHIIASGIKKVVYIEPYPKSYAVQLYSGELIVSRTAELGSAKVRFEPFIGIAPYRYREFFERARRKDSSGAAMLWRSGHPELLHQSDFAMFSAYVELEKAYLGKNQRDILAAGIVEPVSARG